MNELMREIGKAKYNGDIIKYIQLKNVYDILKYYQKHINYDIQKKAWLEMNKTFENIIQIPQLPRPIRQYHIDALIRCGAIPKKDLIIGETYYGKCRNADVAIWKGDVFEYERQKFYDVYMENINHFEDDDGYDLFVPIKKANH